MPKPPGQSAFRLRIQLIDVDPGIWRRILVPGSIRMSKLAEILLSAMGWSNSHLHAFTIGDQRYGMNYDDFPDGEIDEKTVTVLQALRSVHRFTFEYDFGDSWEHEIVIEELTKSPIGLKYAVCLDGANACPPDDVGGTWGSDRASWNCRDHLGGCHSCRRVAPSLGEVVQAVVSDSDFDRLVWWPR